MGPKQQGQCVRDELVAGQQEVEQRIASMEREKIECLREVEKLRQSLFWLSGLRMLRQQRSLEGPTR